MKRLVFVLLLTMIGIVACCQNHDHTFKVPVMFEQGFYFGDSTYMNTAATGGGTVTWDAITGKPSTYPPSAHEHNSLYKPIGYVPSWAELTGKPATYPPSAHTHLWTEITNKPTEIELINEIPQMTYFEPHAYTTAEINALVIPSGKMVIVVDKTLGVLKFWNGTAWKTLITNQ